MLYPQRDLKVYHFLLFKSISIHIAELHQPEVTVFFLKEVFITPLTLVWAHVIMYNVGQFVWTYNSHGLVTQVSNIEVPLCDVLMEG